MYGLEKRLSRIDEVEEVSTDAAEGILTILPKSGELIDLDEVKDAITGSGFTPREIEITVTGHVEDWNDWKTLLVNGTERFLLAPAEKVEELETLGKQSAGKVSVSGIATREERDGHKEHPYTLHIQKVLPPQ